MIFLCGALALVSLMLTGLNKQWIAQWVSLSAVQGWLNLLMFKLAAVPISILALFLVYWLLPNRKIIPARVAPAAIIVGLILEALKYVNLAVSPYLQTKLEHEYFIFRHSVAILLWSFVASLVVLGGAEWTARAKRDEQVSLSNGEGCADEELDRPGEGERAGVAAQRVGETDGAAGGNRREIAAADERLDR